MRFAFYCAAVLLLIGTSTVVLADVPQLINYQGVLLDSGGDPVTDPVNVIFAIWNAETDGDSLWSEDRLITPDDRGSFIVMLGSVSDIPDSAFIGEAYLGIKVEADPEMSPRSRLVSVPYSFRVGTIDGASGGEITGSITLPQVGGDTLVLEPQGIVIRGAGGDEEAVYSSSGVGVSGPGNALSVYDSDGDLRFSISLETDGGAVTFFGETDADTNLLLLPGGHVLGKGQLSMGQDVTTAGVWSNALGFNNDASGDSSAVGGGYSNVASGQASTISGGSANESTQSGATVGGGAINSATGYGTTVSGGIANIAGPGDHATVGGGRENHATNSFSFVGGGYSNGATGPYSTVPGGYENIANGIYSFAAGNNARASHPNSFVWNDGTASAYTTTAANQFLIRAMAGVGINTNAPTEALDVNGNIHASGTITSGSSITIDGTADQITASSGTIDFADEQLVTTGGVNVGGFQMSTGATAGHVLTSDGSGVGTWQAAGGGGAVGMIPVGGITAWLKSFPNTPALPVQFVECNGQTISDPESVFDGQTVPDLNGNSGTSRFLRGATASGAIGGSEGHAHSIPYSVMGAYTGSSWPRLASTSTYSSSSLPSFYGVVWIMRIK